MGLSTPHLKLFTLPLPQEKVESMEILREANYATAALAELKGIANLLPRQEILLNAAVLQESKDSSEIENIITSTDELYEALNQNTPIPDPALKEVIGYRTALLTGFNLLKENGFLRVNDIKKIQALLVGNDAGLRRTPGTVLKNDKTGKVVYTPPQDPKEIKNLLSNFIKVYNRPKDDVLPLIQLAVLHHQFESIHPFYDGNGRVGRILNVLYLFLTEQLDSPILYLSSYLIKHKTKYYQLLNQTNQTGDYEEWIIFILRAIAATASETIQKIRELKALLDETIETAKKEIPKVYSKELVELLFEHPYCKIEFVVRTVGVERKAASRYLKSLEQIGILKSRKVGREMFYINHKLMALLETSTL